MSKRKIFAFSAALLCGLVVAGVAWAMNSASYAVNSTLGQVAIGLSGSTSYGLGTGYGVVEAAPPPLG